MLAQFEQHANRAYRTLIKFLALQHLRQDFIWVIDVSTLGTNRGPRPTRVKMFKSEMSKTARECCRRSTLECERRWCNNKTEVIDDADIVNTDRDLLVSVLDLRTVLCPHLDSSTDMPKLRQLVLDEYVKYGLKDYDLQAQRNATLSAEFVESQKKRQRTAQGDTRAVMRPEPQRPLSIGLSAGDAPTGKGWGSESEEEGVAVVVEQTPEARELRGKELQKEAASALRKWRKHGKELDWAPFVKCPGVVCPAVVDKPPARIVLGEADDADVTITEEPAPVVQKKVYDLMDDLLEADVLKLYRQVLAEEEALVKAGGQAQFGYLPRMALANIGAMNAESFCERTLSCASLIVTDLHTNLSREEVRMLTMLRMNVSLMEYMRGEYDNLRSKIQASETRITKELRDKAEKQAREASTMDET